MSKSLSAWVLHSRFRFHHVRGLHFKKKLLIFVCAHSCTPACMQPYVYEGSEDNLQELVLFFHYMGSGDQTQVSGLAASTFIH